MSLVCYIDWHNVLFLVDYLDQWFNLSFPVGFAPAAPVKTGRSWRKDWLNMVAI